MPITRPRLAKEMSFDLSLARVSFLVEVMSNVLIALVPTPAYTAHVAGAKKGSRRPSEMLFVTASSLGCFGSGVVPAAQSLGLCVLQMRNLSAGDSMELEGGVGSLFGAFAVLQAVGSTILGVSGLYY